MTRERREKAAKPPKALKAPKTPSERRKRHWWPSFKRRAKTPKPAADSQVILAPYVRPSARWVGITLIAILGLVSFLYGFGFSTFAPYRIVQFVLPILFLGAMTIWALPELGGAPTTLLERVFFLFFLALPLWPNYLAIVLPGLPWITFLRLTGFPLAFLLLLSVSISRQFRKEAGAPLKAVPFLWRGIAAFALYQIFSVTLSNAPQISIDRLLNSLINWTAIFFVSAWVFSKPGRVERWALLMWVIAIYLSFLSAREFMAGKILWAGHIPSFLAVEDDSVIRSLSAKVRAGSTQYRTAATFSTPLGLGEYMALATPFALHFMASAYRAPVRVIAALSIPLIFNTILLTDTRLGMVGFLIGCVLYLFCWGALRWMQKRGSLIGPIIVLSYPAVMVAVTAAVLLVPRIRVMTLGGGKHQASTEARAEQIRLGIPKVLQHPFGYGIGRGGSGLGYVNPSGTLTIDNYYLLIAMDYGIFGFVIFYAMFMVAIGAGFRGVLIGPRNREHTLLIPISIALTSFFIIKSVYSGVENQPMVFMMLGAVTALVYRIKVANGQMPPLAPKS